MSEIMRWLTKISLRFRSLFHRSGADGELDSEMRFHLEQQIAANISAGMSAVEARRTALREFGGVEQLKEECRDMRHTNYIHDFVQDLRYGVRILRKSPGFTIVAVLTLALGIGANATIFSFVNAILLHTPSGIAAPRQLVSVWNRLPDGQAMQFSYPDYLYFRDHNQVFSNFIAYSSDPTQASWTQAGHSSLVGVRLVSANYFSTLGVKAIMRRGFSPNEDVNPGSPSIVVVSHRFWEERLGSDRAILGRTVMLNGRSFVVVGVAPANFADLEPGFETDFWAPITMQKVLSPGMDLLSQRTGYWIFVVGRLKPGVTRKQAQANLSVIAQQLAQAHPDTNKGWGATVSSITGLDPGTRGSVVAFAALIMVVSGLVLLIACANVANLLLAQAASRQREMTIRAALGAERSRIFRQVLTESTLLSLLAGGVGILFCVWAGPLIIALKPALLSFIQLDLPLDWHMIAFTVLVSVVTGVIFGFLPALRSSKIDLAARLKDQSRGSHVKSRFRNVLVVVQVAVCLLLLISASLCLRSLMNAQSIDPGFQATDRAAVEMDPGILGYTDARAKAFYSEAIEHLRALPGVRSASVTDYLPLGFESTGQGIVLEGRSASDTKNDVVGAMSVGPGYFATMGIPLLEGREFLAEDNETAPSVVIVNKALAKRYWHGRSPVGQRISTGRDAKHQRVWSEIVGVVPTGKYRSLRETDLPFVYHPFVQGFDAHATLVVQTASDSKLMLPTIRRAVQAIDPTLPILEAQTMQSYMSVPLFPAHITGVLLGTFGGLGLVLAMVGLYGVIAYSVAERTHEIGIRIALGAERQNVLRLVVGQGLRLTLIGAAIGLTAAFAATRLLSSLLYGVSATDPLTFAGVTILLTIVALAACYIPARRAMRVDPMVALRYE
jgi:predicted permease